MFRRPTVLAMAVATLWSAASGHVRARTAQQQPSSQASTVPAPQQRRAFLNQYCVGCHNQKARIGGLALDNTSVTPAPEQTEVWEKVVRKLRGGLMPPAGRPRPSIADQQTFLSSLEADLDRASAARPDPGRTEAFHRLNRAEYHNAIRDLLAVDIDVAALLPADDASYGFDNIAGVLTLDQSRMEQYLSAAQKISRAAIGEAALEATAQEFRLPESLPQYEHVDGLPFGTRGGTLIHYTFPEDAEYIIDVGLRCRIAGQCDGGAGFADRHQLEVTVDGERLQLFTIEPRETPRPARDQVMQVRTRVKAGRHDVAVAFLKLSSVQEVESLRERFVRPYYLNGNQVVGSTNAIYQPFVDSVTIKGPFGGTGPGETPSRRLIFMCHPATAADEVPCATKILSRLAQRAYRRTATDADVAALLKSYQTGRARAGFEAGLETALRHLLVSPEFVFRVELEPRNVAPGGVYRISDPELASRLSFFLWSSIPDDELLDLATRGKLADPVVLDRQVRRMLADPKSNALISNFVSQWLQIRNLDSVRPDLQLFPNFDDGLRLGLRRETELFVESILAENRSTLDLLTADYTFVNERVARHYGMQNVYGDFFRRVTLTDPNRRGLLSQGSILIVTSRPNRTSPVLRGKWILSNLLGTPPADPPADVPPLAERDAESLANAVSVRERMAQHRANPSCASCHMVMDPAGFALENFDAVGHWRDVDESFNRIDASGALPDGTAFNGLAEFREAILRDPRQFVTTVTEKLLTYALGRGVEYYDMPAVRAIVRDSAPGGYRLSALITGITSSRPFLMRRAESNVSSAPAAGRQ
jgi:mono/diheme cytochrome c family protein